MLLVLGGVAGDRPVAELAELDAELLGRDAVGAVADDGPVALRRGQLLGGHRRCRRAGRRWPPSRSGRSRRAATSAGSTVPPTSSAIAQASRKPGGDLRVEGLGGRDAHLHVAAVGRVEHAVGLVGEVGAAPVDDGEHRGAAVAHEVDGAVGVGGGARLADRDDEGVAHVGAQPEARELGGGERLDPEAPVGDAWRRSARGQALAGDVGGALADHLDAADAAVAQALAHRGGEHVVAERHLQPTVALDELAAQRLAEAGGRLGDLLQQEVRVGAAVDVAGGDLRLLEVGLGHRAAAVPS